MKLKLLKYIRILDLNDYNSLQRIFTPIMIDSVIWPPFCTMSSEKAIHSCENTL